MGDIFSPDDADTTTVVKPQLPNAAQIVTPKVQPGNNQVAAPQIPSLNPPNVDGGTASFSAITQSILDLAKAKQAELSASADTLKANQSVDSQASTQLSDVQKRSLDAYGNINKANKLPGGPGGHIAKIFSMFDSDYNIDVQRTNLQAAQTEGESIKNRAQAIKEQNNLMPALLAKIADAENVVYQAQIEGNKLAQEQQKIDDAHLNTIIRSKELSISMDRNHREATKFAIDGMSMDQIKNMLPQAQAGKGPFKGLAGLLEERLTAQDSAQTSLSLAKLSLAKGNREEYNDNLSDFVSHLPVDKALGLMQNAQKQGMNGVPVPMGKGPDGKDQTEIVPFNIWQAGMIKANEMDDKANAIVAARITQKQKLIPNVQNLARAANSFAGVDRSAAQLTVRLANTVEGLQAKDPNSVIQTGIQVASMQDDMDKIAKLQADKYSTPEAKAAIISYGKGNDFDAHGGVAVVVDSMGVPGLTNNTLFKDVWKQIGLDTAQQVKLEHTDASVPASTGNSTTDAANLLATFQRTQGREKLNTIASNILSDPNKTQKYATMVKGQLMAKTFKDVLVGLSQQKDANPIWKDMVDNRDQFVDGTSGKFSWSKVFDKLEAARVTSGGKIDYAANLLKGLENYGVNAQNLSSTDPSYTYQDHALVSALFGSDPTQNVVGDMHYTFRTLATRAKADMQKRIDYDLNGQTQRTAVMDADPAFGEYPGPTDNKVFRHTTKEQILKRTGVNLDAVPSATGTGQTAEQIKQLFGGGH